MVEQTTPDKGAPDIAMHLFATRAAAQTGGLLILMTLTFVSAGTIYFWQGWLFWLSFLASSIAIGVYLVSATQRCSNAGCESARLPSHAEFKR